MWRPPIVLTTLARTPALVGAPVRRTTRAKVAFAPLSLRSIVAQAAPQSTDVRWRTTPPSTVPVVPHPALAPDSEGRARVAGEAGGGPLNRPAPPLAPPPPS